ncbi:nonstructural protein [Microviridae sp.]|nr:nonstructural protein [Microviridae sp.]
MSNFYAVYDIKAQYYLAPFTSVNDHTAKRAFIGACSDPDTKLYKFPTDYELFHVGEFLEETGELVPVEAKRSLGLAASYKRLDFYGVDPVETTTTEEGTQ